MPQPPASERLAAAAAEVPKVIYIMGAGRSGSTILGVALGNCAGAMFAGELDHWLVKGGKPSGKRPAAERFWSEIAAQMGDQRELFGGKTTALERSSALLDPRRWPRRRRLRGRYRQASQTLYQALARVTHATHIVDTSHYPLRARELRALAGIELYLLYLTREPQSVVASLARRDVRERAFGPLAANAYLWLTQLFSIAVFITHPRSQRVRVRYEDFIARPEAVLADILRACDSTAQPPDLATLDTGVPFHGNRLIERRTMNLERTQPKPAGRLSPTALIQLPWTALAALLRPVAAGR